MLHHEKNVVYLYLPFYFYIFFQALWLCQRFSSRREKMLLGKMRSGMLLTHVAWPMPE